MQLLDACSSLKVVCEWLIRRSVYWLKSKEKERKWDVKALPLTRALAKGLGVGVPNVAVSHDVVNFSKSGKREGNRDLYLNQIKKILK